MKVIIMLSIGTVLMMISMIFQAKKRTNAIWKAIPISLLLTIVGTVGTYLWFFVENGYLAGRSFYGAVFVVPIAFILVAKLMNVSYGDIMDMCAASECVMLCIMKVQCIRDGCCAGRVLFYDKHGFSVDFPSQLVELIVALIIFITLLIVFYNNKTKGILYPWYLIIYGGTRFVLNFFRAEWEKYDGGMIPFGTVWSVVAVTSGVIWLLVIKRIDAKKRLINNV